MQYGTVSRLVYGIRHCRFRFNFGRMILRGYKVLALESSCDDSCIALLEKKGLQITVIDEVKKTLNSQKFGGIVPTEAYEFHQRVIGPTVHEFCKKNQLDTNPPDIICCTRGPGMVGSLSVSLQLAKGLSVAWNKPLIGVHHMLGHTLIPKLESDELQYPFLSLLASGGHTMLVHLKSVSEHEVLVDTCDIAVGDSLDKCARELGIEGNILGKEMERYVNSIDESTRQRFESISTFSRDNEFNFKLSLPMRGPSMKAVPGNIQFSFAPFLSTIKHFKQNNYMDEKTRQFIAYKTQQFLFRHVIDRVNVALEKHGVKQGRVMGDGTLKGVKQLVFSGGVASNRLFRSMLQQELKLHFLDTDIEFQFPSVTWCTDNAVMIGVAGIEIFEQLQVRSDLGIMPIRKWPMSELINVGGWVPMEESEVRKIVNSNM